MDEPLTGAAGAGPPVSRRALLRHGLGLGLGGAASLLALPRLARGAPGPGAARAVILVWLEGGASHLDTFDPKPGTREAGAARAIDTRRAGVRLAEHLPRLAERADRLALVRGLASREGDHARATHLVHTGFTPSTTIAHPSLGALLAAERPGDGAVPPFVSLGTDPVGPGWRGVGAAALEVGGPGATPLERRSDLDPARLAARQALAADLERGFAAEVGLSPGPGGPGSPGRAGDPGPRAAAWARAARVLEGPLGRALALDAELAGARDAFGRTPAGEGLLRARRLVEAGVGCVEVVLGGWDDHQDLDRGLPPRARALDQALAALLDDLDGRGALGRTLVLCISEFGRTPDLNARGGRDHWPHAFPALLFGGGLRPGVVGATTPDGRAPAGAPVRVADLLATVLARLGLDPAAERWAGERPVTLADGGTSLAALLPS